jgi:hypothetical protein
MVSFVSNHNAVEINSRVRPLPTDIDSNQNSARACFFFAIIMLSYLLIGCATLPDNSDRIPSHTFSETQGTELGRAFNLQRKKHPERSGFLLLSRGLDAFVARAALA